MRQDDDELTLFSSDELADVPEEIEGTVERVIFDSPEGKFAVFQLTPSGQRRRVTVTVPAAAPLVGQIVHVTGGWTVHPKFGQQFRAASIHIEAPTSAEGIERFLASGLIEGCGPAIAHRIVKKFGRRTLDIIEQHPHRLTEISGIGKQTAEKIAKSYNAQSELREVMLWLEDHGISGALAARIYKEYGSFSTDMLENHPYQIASEVAGIGFETADAIAASLGLEPDSEARILGGLDYELQRVASSRGHCCVTDDELVRSGARKLRVDPVRVSEVLHQEIEAGRAAVEYHAGRTYIYLPSLYRAECHVAERLTELQRAAAHLLPSTRMEEAAADLVSRWETAKGQGMKLAEGQRAALMGALVHGVFVLTGGPGTGKTTVVRGMLDILEQRGLEVLLAAPTGRAAKRLAETTGRQAVTVHRLLEAQGASDARGTLVFGRDADEPLDADAIIVDEVSMMDIVLMDSLLTAIPDGCHLILVGDADQLPSVGPGAVLQDIIRSEAVPCVRLTEIFRQSDASTIVLNAHAINAGRLPICAPTGDFQFWEHADQAGVVRHILQLCRDELPRQGRDVLREVQVLSPMHGQECGVDNLNRQLQAVLNPPAPGRPEFKGGVRVLRLGDKVMQTRNNYDKEVFNGDIGFITLIEPESVEVDYGGHVVDYAREELGELTLAYCLSVHKSQGSEYPIVILPLVDGHHIMLQRNLLYTAVTRAREQVILLGTKAALNTAVTTDRNRLRSTLLAERLSGTIAEQAR